MLCGSTGLGAKGGVVTGTLWCVRLHARPPVSPMAMNAFIRSPLALTAQPPRQHGKPLETNRGK